MFPNCILVFHPNWVSHMTLSPMSVDQVRITHRMLVSSERLAEAEAAPDVASRLEKSLQLIDGQVFQKEDFAIAESIQRTFAAGADEELILGDFESGMRLFHEARDRALAPTS